VPQIPAFGPASGKALQAVLPEHPETVAVVLQPWTQLPVAPVEAWQKVPAGQSSAL
jgi:hypothetical protein